MKLLKHITKFWPQQVWIVKHHGEIVGVYASDKLATAAMLKRVAKHRLRAVISKSDVMSIRYTVCDVQHYITAVKHVVRKTAK